MRRSRWSTGRRRKPKLRPRRSTPSTTTCMGPFPRPRDDSRPELLTTPPIPSCCCGCTRRWYTTFEVFGRYVRRLTPDELEQAYEESKIAAKLLRVPEEILPPDMKSFRTYFDGMISSDAIAVAPFQRALAKDILYPSIRFVPKPALWPTVAVTASLLPPKVRKAYGLGQNFVERQIAGWSHRLVRAILPVAPGVIRDMPQARRAEIRVREGRV